MTEDRRFEQARSVSLDFDGVLSTLILGRRWAKTHAGRPPVPLLTPAVRALRAGVACLTQRYRKPYPHAEAVLRALRSSGKELYLLTSRNGERIAPAERWLERRAWRGFFERLLFNVEGEDADAFKAKMLREHPIDVHIDDDPETVARLAALFPGKLFIHLDHQPGRGQGGKNIAVVADWQELAELFGVKPMLF
jgi:FMN phosphatase YigB (HAD superfamily)